MNAGAVAEWLEGKLNSNTASSAVSPSIAEQGLKRKVLSPGAAQNSSAVLGNSGRGVVEDLKMSRVQRLEIRTRMLRSFHQFGKNPTNLDFVLIAIY